MHTSCDHHFHVECFQKHWSEWHLPCPVCHRRLGCVRQDDHQECLVGVPTDQTFECFYKITKESKIVPHTASVPNWIRKNGRLERPCFMPVHYNMCVS